MANTDQAQADQNSPATVEDPLDASDTQQNGDSDLAAYEAEVAQLDVSKLPGDEESPEDEDAGEGELADEDALTEEQSEEGEYEDANEESLEEDAGEEDPPTQSNRFRVRAKDEVEVEALALRKRHPDWSLKDCIAKAESILGLDVESGEKVEGEADRESVDSVNAQIEELRRRRKEATSEMEFETAADIADQIDDLRDKRDALRARESQARAEADEQAAQQFEQTYEQSKKRTVTYYPETTVADHPMLKRMLQMDAQMREMGDPLYNDPDKPWILATRVAQALKIPMTKPGTNPPGKTSRSLKSPIQPASGNRGTSITDSSKRFEAEMDKIESLEDYERLVGRG